MTVAARRRAGTSEHRISKPPSARNAEAGMIDSRLERRPAAKTDKAMLAVPIPSAHPCSVASTPEAIAASNVTKAGRFVIAATSVSTSCAAAGIGRAVTATTKPHAARLALATRVSSPKNLTASL